MDIHGKEEMMRKSTTIVIVIVIVIVAIAGIIGWKIFKAVKLRQSEGWKDAHPTQKQINSWLIKNFDPNDYKIWNKNPKLDSKKYKWSKIWEIVQNKIYYSTPYGEDNWAVSCFSWRRVDKKKVIIKPIKFCNIIYKPNSLSMFVSHGNREHPMEYGIGSILQGWAHKNPPPFNHHIPPPLETRNKKIILSFDIKIEKTITEKKNNYRWQYIGTNIWFKSNEIKKPLTMDLMIYCSNNQLYTMSTEYNYRYQKVLIEKEGVVNKWQHYNIDVSWFVQDALKKFEINYAGDTLKLYSFEILCETKFGTCSFEVKNIYLYYKNLASR